MVTLSIISPWSGLLCPLVFTSTFSDTCFDGDQVFELKALGDLQIDKLVLIKAYTSPILSGKSEKDQPKEKTVKAEWRSISNQAVFWNEILNRRDERY